MDTRDQFEHRGNGGKFEVKAGFGGGGRRFGEVELVLPKRRKFGDIIFKVRLKVGVANHAEFSQDGQKRGRIL